MKLLVIILLLFNVQDLTVKIIIHFFQLLYPSIPILFLRRSRGLKIRAVICFCFPFFLPKCKYRHGDDERRNSVGNKK